MGINNRREHCQALKASATAIGITGSGALLTFALSPGTQPLAIGLFILFAVYSIGFIALFAIGVIAGFYSSPPGKVVSNGL